MWTWTVSILFDSLDLPASGISRCAFARGAVRRPDRRKSLLDVSARIFDFWPRFRRRLPRERRYDRLLMKFSRRSRGAASLPQLALCLLLGLGSCLVLPPAARAQVQLPAAGGPIVRQIDVQYVGRATITRERVLAQMRTAVGQPFNQANAEADIRSLYGTGDVTNVRIFSQPAAGGVKVIVFLQTRATVPAVVIVGEQK